MLVNSLKSITWKSKLGIQRTFKTQILHESIRKIKLIFLCLLNIVSSKTLIKAPTCFEFTTRNKKCPNDEPSRYSRSVEVR